MIQEPNYKQQTGFAGEGVIQFTLDQKHQSPFQCDGFAELNSWRSYLFRLGLVGQDSQRYGGYGYGNLSHRMNPDSSSFLISGTQTGHLPLLCKEHYAVVESASLDQNQIKAYGSIKPSSEALTHAAIYMARPDIQTVMHVHSPLLWQKAQDMGLTCTDPSITYGTPEMANATIQCVTARSASTGIVAMLGHEDGIVVYSDSVDGAGSALLQAIARARQL